MSLRLDWRESSDAPAALAVHRSAAGAAPNALVRQDALAHFARHCAQDGRLLGCFVDDGAMVAYGVLGLHSDAVRQLAALLDADPALLCVLDGAATLPEWRGHSLHVGAILQRVRLGAQLGRPSVAATVAPHNIRSLRALFHAAFTVHGYANLYGGVPRLLVRREAHSGAQLWRERALVPVAQPAQHQLALAAGLRGYACRQDDAGHWYIVYGVPLSD